MKKPLAILTLLILFRPILPVVEYVINYDYIAQVLCENKAKPELQCNGKCHLMKEMAKSSEADKPLQNDKKTTHLESEVLFFQEIDPLKVVEVIFYQNSKVKSVYANLYTHLSISSVFHPPTV